MEPSDHQTTSPYLFGVNYRIPLTSPSPTPSHSAVSPSPQNFLTQTSTSPISYNPSNNNNNDINNENIQIESSILQNHLQASIRNLNNYQSSPQQNTFTPNIITPTVTYTLDNNTIWNGNNNLIGTSSRVTSLYNNVANTNNPSTSMTSTIFNQPLNPVQAFTNNNILNNSNINNNNYEHKSNFSSLLDLDSQQLLSEQVLNLSGEMQNLSFGDCVMESFNKHDK